MTLHLPTNHARRIALTLAVAALAAVSLSGCNAAASPTPVASPTLEAAATLPAATVPTIEPSPTAAEATATATAIAKETIQPTTEPTATAVPSDTPTPVPAEPTATTEPTQAPQTGPTFSISPRSGGPGTAVHMTGSHFPPGKMVTIRIGLPNPIGEALGSAKVAADGTWEATAKIPGTLPSGQPITTTNMQLVPMDENNQPYATQPFSFAP